MTLFGLVVVRVDLGTQLLFLDDGLLLVLARLACLLSRLVLVLAVVHDLANRRFCIWSYFDKVEIGVHGDAEGVFDAHDAYLLATWSNQADFRYSNALVDTGLSADGASYVVLNSFEEHPAPSDRKALHKAGPKADQDRHRVPVTGPLHRYGQWWELGLHLLSLTYAGTVAHASLAGMTEVPDIRELAEIPAVEVITRAAVMLMSAAAEKLGLSAEDPDDSPHRDLDEARRLITALAGLVTASAEYLGPHAGPVRDGLKTLQLAFRESSAVPDEARPGSGRETHRPRLVAVTTISAIERISSRPMTLTSPPLVRPKSRYSWVPAAAGWTVGVIATLSLLASVSPGDPVAHQGTARVRQRLHLQLPRHQLRVGVRAGAAGRRAGGPKAPRLVDPHPLHGRVDRLEHLRHRRRRRDLDAGNRRDDRSRLPHRRGRVPGTGPQGVLGEGPPRGADQGGRRAGGRDGGRNPRRLGPARTVPRHAGTRLPAGVRGEPRCRLRRRRRQRVRRPAPACLRQRHPRPVRRAGADGRRNRAVPVAALGERTHRRGRVSHPRPLGAVRQERLTRLLRHPTRQGRGVRAERTRGDHLPRRGGRVPCQW